MGSQRLIKGRVVLHTLLRAGGQVMGAMMIFSAVFLLVPISASIYLLLFDGLWLWLLLRYGSQKNVWLFQRGMFLSMGCSGAFLAVKLLSGHPLRMPRGAESGLLIVAVVEIGAALFLCRGKKNKRERTESEETEEEKNSSQLYPERKYDLDRIVDYVMRFELTGVNAGWGKGKSFLMEHLKKVRAIQDQFEIIQINLLSCALDDVELILIGELEKVFRRSRIYPENSLHLKSLLSGNPWTSMLWDQMGESGAGMTASFDGVRKELDRLDRKILIIFEDIDRISDKATIQKVFSIGEYMSDPSLHIIYQYDAQALEKEGFDRDYLEKYIPYTVNLTHIPYESLVKYMWKELGMEETLLEMDKVRDIPRHMPGQFELERLLKAQLSISTELGAQVSARKVRIFLSELKELLETNPELCRAETIETVCAVVFIKHFFDSKYSLFYIGKSPLQELTLNWEGEAYPLPRLLSRLREEEERRGKAGFALQSFRELMRNSEERVTLALLLLLGYNLELEPLAPGLEKAASEPVKNLRLKEKNEKIDRIVWNVIANGSSELTNAENAIRKLWEDVLSKEPGQPRAQAWNSYQNDMFHRRLRKDNQSIFWFGGGEFLPLFQAMSIMEPGEEKWKQFLEFYFSQYQGKNISRQLIDNLKYCTANSKTVLFQVIRFFNTLEVVGNLNSDRSYQLFLERYMEWAVNLGYCDGMESWMFRFPGTAAEFPDSIIDTLTQYRKELERLKGRQSVSYVAEEFTAIICFIDKNLELIRSSSALPERGPSVQVKDIRSRWVHQEEVDRLKKLRETDPEHFEEELEKSYQEGRIYYREWKDIMALR